MKNPIASAPVVQARNPFNTMQRSAVARALRTKAPKQPMDKTAVIPGTANPKLGEPSF